MIVIWLLLACEDAPLGVSARAVPGGVQVTATEPITVVEIADANGPIATRRLPAPADAVFVPVRVGRDEALVARARLGSREATSPIQPRPTADALLVEAPLGQEPVPIEAGAVVDIARVGGGAVQVGLVAVPESEEPVELSLGDAHLAQVGRPGERVALLTSLTADVDGLAVLGDDRRPFRIRLVEVADAGLTLQAVDFPTDALGQVDLALPSGRVTLPSPGWRLLLDHTPLGVRTSDPWLPWAHLAADVHNDGDRALHVAVRLRVLDAEGLPAPAFRPRLRDRTDPSGDVRVLLRVPPKATARAVLPLWVDEAALPSGEPGLYRREITVLPLGAEEPAALDVVTLPVSRGRTGIGGLALVGAVAGVGGLVFLAATVGRHLRSRRTEDLVSVALIASLLVATGIAVQLVATSVGAVLGPFAPLVTGLVDDAVTVGLLAALVALRPNVGVIGLALTLWALVRGLGLGGISPFDLLFLGSRVLWLELGAWLAGLTRGADWTTSPPFLRWLRLFLGFGPAWFLATLCATALQMVLYRLWLADWYVAIIALGPGLLYVAIATALAVPLASSVRQMDTGC